MSDHTLSQIFAVLNANDTYGKLQKVLQKGMRLSDDYQIFLFSYLAHGYGLKAQKGIALNPQYSTRPIVFTSEEMHVLQVAADVVKRQPSFNAEQLKRSLIYHRGERDESEDDENKKYHTADEDEDWFNDTDLHLPPLPKQRSIYVYDSQDSDSEESIYDYDGTKQNPYFITMVK